MPKTAIVETERLYLRVLEDRHAGITLEYYLRNRHFLKKWEPRRPPSFYTLEGQRRILKWDLKEMSSGRMFKVWIFKKSNGFKRTIGSVALNNIIRGSFLSCHLGYKLDKDEINKGYMTEALKSIIDFAFNDLRLHRLEANIMPHNLASLKVVEKLGFQPEGLAKKYLKIDGKWQDHIHMVLLNKAME